MEQELQLARRVARRHGIGADGVRAGGRQGVATAVFEVGSSLVLRVARAGFAEDLAREAAVLPLASAAGLPVPDIVDAEPAWLLQRRMPGVPLDTPGAAFRQWDASYAGLGRLLREVSSLDVPDEVAARLPRPPLADPVRLLAKLRDGAWLGSADAAWLEAWFARLGPWQPSCDEATLTHGDAAPSNVLVDPATGAVTALLDWGDTAICPPAVDLAKIPPVHLPAAVRGYTAPGEPELAWAAQALWHHLAWALGRLGTAPRPHDSSWSAPPAARLLGLLQLLAELPGEWRELLPPSDH